MQPCVFPPSSLNIPLEALIAGVLLLALLFGSADRHAAEVAAPSAAAPRWPRRDKM